MIVEVCAGSVRDCVVASKYGATRVELNSGLHLGGLTPSLATLIQAKKLSDVSIICMVRPRGGGFCYDAYEKDTILADAKLLLQHGADGLAFGFLTEDRTIDVEWTKKLIDLCHEFGKEAVFHRAFDCAVDLDVAIQQLITLGCDRILTSGGQENVVKGTEMLAYLQRQYGEQIELLMGSGVSFENVVEVMRATHITQCHASCKGWVKDQTTKGNGVDYSYGEPMCYDEVNEEKLERLMNAVQSNQMIGDKK